MVNKNHGHETCVNKYAKTVLNRRLFENFFQKKNENENKRFPFWQWQMARKNGPWKSKSVHAMKGY